MWDQAPLDQVKRAPARLVVLPDDQQLLARRSVVARANSSHAAVADIEAFDNRRAEWSRTLDYAATQTGIPDTITLRCPIKDAQCSRRCSPKKNEYIFRRYDFVVDITI